MEKNNIQLKRLLADLYIITENEEFSSSYSQIKKDLGQLILNDTTTFVFIFDILEDFINLFEFDFYREEFVILVLK